MNDDTTFEFNISLVVTRCITCGLNFGLPSTFVSDRREDQANFNCPNGHRMLYKTKPYAELEKELEKAKESVRELHQSEMKLSSELDQLKAKLEQLLSEQPTIQTQALDESKEEK